MNKHLIFLAFLVMQSLLLCGQTVVTIKGRNILVNDSVYTIRGVCYNPVAIGDDRFDPLDFSHIDQDILLMKQAGINTIRTYVPITSQKVLDKFAAAGIRIIMGFPNYDDTFQYPDIHHGTYLNYITTYKNHDAMLIWELGNEYNYHPEWFNNDINNWYAILNNAAYAIHQVDPTHPVSTAHGEVPSTNALNLCYYVDVWGMNVYRWDDPSGAIDQFGQASLKPCYLSEAGADRFNTQQGQENQQNQADADLAIWNAVKGKLDVCSGITFFAFVDEWWKGGNPNTHDPSGFSMSIPYDSYANEEWWGIVDIYRNTTLAYAALKNAFTENASSIGDPFMQQSMQFYPNPATETAFLKIPESMTGHVTLSFFGISGNLIREEEIKPRGHDMEIPLNDYGLQKGVYLVKATNKSLNFNTLLLVQ